MSGGQLPDLAVSLGATDEVGADKSVEGGVGPSLHRGLPP